MKNHDVKPIPGAASNRATWKARFKRTPKTVTSALLTALAFITLGVLSAIGWGYGLWQKKERGSARNLIGGNTPVSSGNATTRSP